MLPSTEKLVRALKKGSLPLEDRLVLTNILMDKIGVLPLEGSIVTSPQGIQVNGKLLDGEQTANFKLSCIALVDNFARKVVRDQVRYLAIAEGIHKGLSPEQILFSKTALWNMQQEDKVIEEVITQGTGYQA